MVDSVGSEEKNFLRMGREMTLSVFPFLFLPFPFPLLFFPMIFFFFYEFKNTR